MPSGIITLIIATGTMFAMLIIISTVGNYYSLNRIKDKNCWTRTARHGSLGNKKRDKENLQAN